MEGPHTAGKKDTLSMDININSLGDVKTVGDAMVPEELIRDVTKFSVIDERWWYWSDEGSARYINMTKDPDYGIFSHSIELLNSTIHKITKSVLAQYLEWGIGAHKGMIDFIPLGAGDLKKEGIVLNAFLERHFKNSVLPVRLVPLDMSMPLLYRAITAATHMFSGQIQSGSLSVSPYLADYTKLGASSFGDSEYRFFTAFATIHNSEFPDILTTYRNLMTEKSVLLLDVDAVDGRGDFQILKTYNNPGAHRFFYTPLGLIQKGAMNGGTILDGDSVIGDLSDYKRCTLDGGEVEPEILSTVGIDPFIKKYSLPQEAGRKLRISPDPHDKTAMIIYQPRRNSYPHPIVLGYSTRFYRPNFKQKLEEAGFEVMANYFDVELGTNSMYLLKLAGT